MTSHILQRRLRAALDGERGFTIIETVIAMTVIFASLTALAYTATIGFRYVAIGRDRIQANGVANQIMEEIRGLAYSKITAGMSNADLTGDSRIVTCSGVKRFESCAGEKIISSTFSGSYGANWVVPHTGSFTAGTLDVTWHTYITNNSPATSPYRVTVIVSWLGGGAAPGNGNNFIRLDSLFWSPSGCVSSATHPFAAPCQPYFYGQAVVPQSSFSIIGNIHDSAVDFSPATLLTPGTESTLQQEQVVEAAATTRSGGSTVTDSTGLQLSGPLLTTSSADSDVGSTTAPVAGATINNGTQYYLERLQPDAGGSVGLQLTIPSGDVGDNGVSIAAKSTDTYACPPSGTRQTDSLACAGSRVKQGNAATAAIPLSHLIGSLGTMTAVRVTAPSTTYSTALVHRDAVAGYAGLVSASASRALGTIQLGGFPTGMTAPSGMSTTNTSDTNYCMRIVGYADTASALAGPRTSTDPSATVTAGTFYYLSGGSYQNKSVTDLSLGTLTVSCAPPAQTISGHTVTWKVTVAAGGISPAKTTETSTPTASDAQTRTEASATANGITVTMLYQLWIDSEQEVDLTVTADLGDLIADGAYGAPPTAG